MIASFDDTNYLLGKLDLVIGIQVLYNRTRSDCVLDDRGGVRKQVNRYPPRASMGLVNRAPSMTFWAIS